MSQTRRLAAILAADVAGYSRLMGADEEGTLERLKALRRELVDPKIAEHHGRIVKTTGDGLLVEFGSVVDALRCAVEVQREMTERNTGVSPDSCIEFRIGINVGDIVVEEGDILVTVSMSQPASKGWPSRAASASRHESRRMLRVASTLPSRTSASSNSRTLPGRSASIGFAVTPPKLRRRRRCHCPTSRRSRCCRLPI